MKNLILLAWLSLGVLASSPALAYRHCSEPSAPSLPSGYNADSDDMERARGDVEYYLEEAREYKDCLLRNMKEISSDAEDVIDEWNDAVNDYNAR